MSTAIKILCAVLFFVLVGGAAYLFISGSSAASELPGDLKTVPMPPPPVVPEAWRKFENAQYGFSVFIPPELVAQTYDEDNGAHTFAFEDAETGSDANGFQIFVVPYNETTISEKRFRRDNPSGVRKEPVGVVIGGPVELGGVTADAFFSENPVMGETREVWFIRGKYLFEVTTYKKDDAWLTDILKTWQFD